MKKGKTISIILIVVSLALSVLGYFVLPDRVVIQFSIGSSGNSTAPKLLAILISAALGIGGAATYLFIKDDGKSSKKGIVVSVIGIVLGIFTIAVNLLMK